MATAVSSSGSRGEARVVAGGGGRGAGEVVAPAGPSEPSKWMKMQRARRTVIGRIRAKLPTGAPEGFSADEIASLDARGTSNQRFVPYEK